LFCISFVGLGLEVAGLGLERTGLGLGLGSATAGDDYKTGNYTAHCNVAIS